MSLISEWMQWPLEPSQEWASNITRLLLYLRKKGNGVGSSDSYRNLVPSMLLVTVPTIHWPSLCRLEGDLSLLPAVRTSDLVHCSGATITASLTHTHETPPRLCSQNRCH